MDTSEVSVITGQPISAVDFAAIQLEGRRIRNAAIAEAYAARDLAAVLGWLSSEERFPHLLRWYEWGISELPTSEDRRLTRNELQSLLAEFWTVTETSSRYRVRRVASARIVRMFKAAGFVTDEPGLQAPTEALTVYRGATPARRLGISWTLDRERAKWFANRHAVVHDSAALFRAVAPPRSVLAIFNSRKEAEVVVNPRGLRDFTALPNCVVTICLTVARQYTRLMIIEAQQGGISHRHEHVELAVRCCRRECPSCGRDSRCVRQCD